MSTILVNKSHDDFFRTITILRFFNNESWWSTPPIYLLWFAIRKVVKVVLSFFSSIHRNTDASGFISPEFLAIVTVLLSFRYTMKIPVKFSN